MTDTVLAEQPGSRALVYRCLIPQPGTRRLLLLPGERGWLLPGWAHRGADRPFWQVIDGVPRALRAHFGLAAPILRCLHVAYDPQRRRLEYVYESESPAPDWVPPAGGRWLGPGDLAPLPLAVPAHRALLDRWFAEADDAAALARRPPGTGRAGSPRRPPGSRNNSRDVVCPPSPRPSSYAPGSAPACCGCGPPTAGCT